MRKIVFNPHILSGKPIFEGTRIPLDLILEYIAQGYSFDHIVKAYPSLTKEDIGEAVKFVAHMIKEEKVFPVPL